jgi:hypothetical protein
MKTYYRSFVLFFLIFSFSILFVSCSQESGITSPDESNAALMAKTAVIPTVKINHAIDTVITLPKSKITITISKSVSVSKISSIDDYLLIQKTSPKTKTSTIQGINPNLRQCQYEFDTVTFWQSEFQYKPMPGKSLGIFNDLNLITYHDALNIYGFSLAGANGFSEIASVRAAGYNYSNIMVEYVNPTSALAILPDTTLYPKCGY